VAARKSQSLQNKITRKIQEKLNRELREKPTESMKCALEVTVRPTCADIFFVPLAVRKFRCLPKDCKEVAGSGGYWRGVQHGHV